ncbi:MAG TPA: hypothetical protein PK198_25610 [Saprospiraceae bacterium]|nr:hypothetical protein [Saprospiraceae bacterium]
MTHQPAFKSWSGYAFENLALRHSLSIKKAMGIHGVITNEYSWTKKKNAHTSGAQIDFIIDRANNCINLFELKFLDAEYEMTEREAASLRKSIHVFREHTDTKKNIFVTMLTVFGAAKNPHYLGIVTNQLTVKYLFL